MYVVEGVFVVFWRRGKRLDVHVGELEDDERELLVGFLRSSLSVDVVLSGGKVSIDSGSLSLEELKRLVTKFVYHRNLNRRYWVKVEGNSVRVGRFEKAKKHEKRRKEATSPRTITHGW